MKNENLHHTVALLLLLLLISFAVKSQRTPAKTNDVYVDDKGVMRWGKSKAEVQGFGVNYTVPFAHAYRTAKKLGISLEQAIDQDVYHFARLGFDAYRVHVWDTEISDSVGNIINNEHLKLFDYMLNKMKERGMKFIITPIAYWGNGWPEPDEKTPGFAQKYGKAECLTNEDAIKAQEVYLFQFLNHVNPYTKVAYKDDPDIVAFEISNEPHHGGTPESVTTFINRMVQSMRKTGCKKPIFYNVSHSIHLVDAYFNADIQGGTFQWYPTGLVAHRELHGNLLPNVEKYTIPFADHAKFKKSAKIVYEFDAADVGRSYIYPAMARSFREAGIQWATHFAYDPTYLAYANTEYNTHYMNLAYTPQKALSLKISSEIFHRVPMYKNFGRYPANTSFDVFKVSYEKDLAEMVTDKKFIYTNHTNTTIPFPDKLEEVAGFGNSSIVQYEGQGAYFLDKIENGVWRLEVMPDAIWVQNPFGRNSLNKTVAVINWRSWPMTINVPDLGEGYSITALNKGNNTKADVTGKTVSIAPGSYLLVKKGVTTKLTGSSRWNTITLNEYTAPATTVDKTYVLHTPFAETVAGKPYNVEATIVTKEEPDAVEVYAEGTRNRAEAIKMKKVSGYTYAAVLPENMIREGFFSYTIVVKQKDQYHTFPSGVEGKPSDWDFYADESYNVRVVGATSSPLYLFNAITDTDALARQWQRGSALMPSKEFGKAMAVINPEKLATVDPENMNGEKINDYSFRYCFKDKVQGRRKDLSAARKIIVQGKSMNEKPCYLQVALITRDGAAYGTLLKVEPTLGDYSVSIADLKKVKMVTLPRPYPTFLPYFFESASTKPFDISTAESIQFSIGPGIAESELDQRHGVGIESVRME